MVFPEKPFIVVLTCAAINLNKTRAFYKILLIKLHLAKFILRSFITNESKKYLIAIITKLKVIRLEFIMPLEPFLKQKHDDEPITEITLHNA